MNASQRFASAIGLFSLFSFCQSIVQSDAQKAAVQTYVAPRKLNGFLFRTV